MGGGIDKIFARWGDPLVPSGKKPWYVCSMYVVCGILQNWSLYPHTLMYSHGTWTQWSLGRVKGHLGVYDLWFKFLKKGHCIHILWCIFMGLEHNDPWVESHMWPQQTWCQMSSRGQWPSVQVFEKKKGHWLYPHTLTYFHGTWINMILGLGPNFLLVHTCDLNRSGVKGHLRVILFTKHLIKWKRIDGINSRNLLGHTCDLNRSGVKGHLGVIDLLVKFWKIVTVSTFFHVLPWELD